MSTSQHIDLPTAGQAANIRITQLDVYRGFAVLGIYWINVIIFGLPTGAYALPNFLGDAVDLNIGHWVFSELFVEGAMRGLFSMLFGASAMVFLDESRLGASGLKVVDRFYRRNLFLILFGMIHAYLLLWPYDVLYAYGLIGLFLFPLRKLNPYALIVAGCMLLLLGDLELLKPETDMPETSIRQSVNMTPADPDSDDVARTQGADHYRETMQLEMEDDIELHRSNYLTIFTKQLDDVVSQQSTYMYSVHFYDIGGMMLFGMALLKLGVLSGKRRRRFYLLLALFGYGVSIAIRSFSIHDELTHGFIPSNLIVHSGVDYSFGRLPLTLGHIGLLGLLCTYRLFDAISRVLSKVGRLALTNYIMQTVISIWLFYGIGLGMIGELERYQLSYVCLSVWLIQIVFSIVWLRFFQFGPLEWVWRSLIYGRRQPLRRTA